ncbi:MAG: methyltransferase [Candidatus Aminicenantes bacterium]|nr:methyltransferase [Candidatus Aminicenantes bacterium]
MKRTQKSLAGIPCDTVALGLIYKRQFRELAGLRRHICSLLPLRRAQKIFEPGCGTGLLARELMALSNASYTGMDICETILPRGEAFLAGDAVRHPRAADLVVASFFFSCVADPVAWLRRVKRRLFPGGLFALFAEYDYEATAIRPDSGFKNTLLSGIRAAGMHTGHAARLDRYFREAGFVKLYGGVAENTTREPDEKFLCMHVDRLPDPLPQIEWRIVWGIWRNRI